MGWNTKKRTRSCVLVCREFFAGEGRFWEVVDHLRTYDLANATEEALHARLTELASGALSHSAQRMLNYALLIRYYSPKVRSLDSRRWEPGRAVRLHEVVID